MVRKLLIVVCIVMFVAAYWLAATAGRVEPVVRNVVYLHVPSAILSLVLFFVVLVGSIAYLATQRSGWDWLAAAAAEVGFAFAIVLNATGMIFSRAEWNTWWTPSPRLVTSAMLLFLYLGYQILRSSLADPRRRARVCAVFGIVAFLDVPLVYMSARFTQDIHRPGFSFGSPWQHGAFGLAVLATLFLAVVLTWMRLDLFRLEHSLAETLRRKELS